MKIAYLKLQNLMLYKNFNRKFHDKDIIGILCEYKDNQTKSNMDYLVCHGQRKKST